jgi:hypothetical protein
MTINQRGCGMPVIRDISLDMDILEILRRQGLSGKIRVQPRIQNLTQELLATLTGDRLLEPAAAYEIDPVTGMNGSRITLGDEKAVHGPFLPAFFPEAQALVVLICTIGPKLETRVSDYAQNGEALRSLLLDGIGTAAVDALISEAVKVIAQEVSVQGYEISSPVNPGMPGFPLTEQWNLLALSAADRIGVSLTSSGILIPRKSASMVIGIGRGMTRWTQAEVCGRCNLRETCPYREAGMNK